MVEIALRVVEIALRVGRVGPHGGCSAVSTVRRRATL
jgi:hypothetical protein